MATVVETTEETSEAASVSAEEAVDMSSKAQRRAESRKDSTSGRSSGEEFQRMGVDDRVTVRLLHAANGDISVLARRTANLWPPSFVSNLT